MPHISFGKKHEKKSLIVRELSDSTTAIIAPCVIFFIWKLLLLIFFEINFDVSMKNRESINGASFVIQDDK